MSEAAKGWITEIDTRALTARKHRFDIAVSEEPEKREGEIYVRSGDKVETVKVYQSGGPLLLLSRNEYVVGSDGGTVTVDVRSNVEYDIDMPDVDWVEEVTATRGASSHTLKFAVAPNEGYDSRSVEIVFRDRNSDLKDTLTLTQAQKDAVILSQKEIEANSEGETVEVKVNSNVDFEVRMPAVDWISQTATRGLQEHSFRFAVSANEGDEERSAKIVFLNKESQSGDTLTVRQRGKNQIIVGDGTYQNGVVSIAEAGTMKKLLGADYLNITSLKVVGPINGDDVYYLRKMLGGRGFSEADWGKLTALDLSEATIVEGGGYYYSYFYNGEREYYTSNNVIGDYMFCHTKLQSIVLPDNVTSIGDFAFIDCTSLLEIVIPDKVTSIGDDAFFWCSSLTSVHIGKGVTSIGAYAFSCCKSLREIVIPDNVTSIGRYAFNDCSSLTSVHIGDGVTSIGDRAFAFCHLTEVYSYNPVPPSIQIDVPSTSYDESSFLELNDSDSAVLYVSARSGMKYKSSAWGRYFEKIIEMEE